MFPDTSERSANSFLGTKEPGKFETAEVDGAEPPLGEKY